MKLTNNDLKLLTTAEKNELRRLNFIVQKNAKLIKTLDTNNDLKSIPKYQILDNQNDNIFNLRHYISYLKRKIKKLNKAHISAN